MLTSLVKSFLTWLYHLMVSSKTLLKWPARILISVRQIMLNCKHDYYYQVAGQLGLTGAKFCDFVFWTEVGIHIEWILLDVALWTEMMTRVTHFYYH